MLFTAPILADWMPLRPGRFPGGSQWPPPAQRQAIQAQGDPDWVGVNIRYIRRREAFSSPIVSNPLRPREFRPATGLV